MTAPSNPREALERVIACVTIDPGDETVAPDISHVLARGFHAMGWSNPQAAAADMIECVAAALVASQPSGNNLRAEFEKAWAKRPWITGEDSDKDRAFRWWSEGAALATLSRPKPEAREAIARLLYKSRGMFDDKTVELHFNWFHTDRTASAEHRQSIVVCYRETDTLLSSGLVQDEAAIRADEREKCAKVAEVKYRDHAHTFGTARAQNYEHAGDAIAAAIRSRSDGGEQG